MTKTPLLGNADYVVGGGGNKIIPLAAALYEMTAIVPAARIVGTSAGGASSVARGMGISFEQLLSCFDHLFARKRILDGDMLTAPFRLGYARGEQLRKTIHKIIGNRTLGEAKIPCGVVVGDHYTPEDGPKVLSSWGTPDVLAVDAVVATIAIPVVFQPQEIRGLGLGNRKFCDGGGLKNFPLNVLDDEPGRPTIGIRVRPRKGDAAENPVRDWGSLGRSLFEMWMWNSNHAHMTSKSRSMIVDINNEGDGLDFDMSPKEIRAMAYEGVTAGRRAAPQALELLTTVL